MNLKGNLTSKGLQGSIGKSRMQGILGTNPAAIPISVDNALSLSSTNPVQNRVITAAITNRLWSDEVKAALLQIVEKVAYIDEHGQDYYDAMYDALYPPTNLDSIGAIFDSSATIYNTDTLDDLKQYLTVTAYYTDGTSETVTTYTLSGSMDAGTQTITVSYGGKTTTFTVTVVEWLVSIAAVFAQGQDTGKTIDSTRINAYIGTAGAWIASSDSYSMCVPVTVGKRYALRFTSTDSTNVGSIFRFGFSDTNTPNGQTLSGWIRTTPQDCAFTEIIADKAYLVIQMGTSVAAGSVSNGYLTLTELAEIVYSTDSLDSLRQYLTVTATYADDTTATVSDYTLAGTLSSGTSSVTINYGGKTTTFNVTVTAWNINWDYTDGDPTEHGFYANPLGTMLSNGYKIAGISGGHTIRHEPDMSYANGVAEIKFTVSVMASSFQGLCFFTPKMRLRIYDNKLYFVSDNSTTAAGQTQIASGLNTTDIYTMRWEWNAATGARVYLNGNLIHTYSAALAATTTRFMANATDATTTVILHSMRFREVS